MPSENVRDGPPKPRLTLRVGITGKRFIPKSERKRVYESLAGVFGALGRFLIECRQKDSDFFSTQPPLLRIICGMAEGADQIAADVASKKFAAEEKKEKEEGARAIETRLAAILPFGQAEFEKDFKQDPERPDGPERTDAEAKPFVDEFKRLLNDDAIESVLEIDDEGLLSTGKKQHRDQAYTNLRDLLLEHADVLVAVSNDKYGGAGGTVDVIGIAAGLEIPVIKISTLKPEIYVMRAAEIDAADQAPGEDKEQEIKLGAELPTAFTDAISRTLEPPRNLAPDRMDPHAVHTSEARPVRERLEAFFEEKPRTAKSDRVFKAFRNALTVFPEPHERFCSKMFAEFRSSWRRYPNELKTADQAATTMWPDQYNRFSADNGARAKMILAQRYGWADVLAVGYADATRSAHIMIAVLGALAVLIALTTLVFPQHPEELALKIKIAALVLEVIVLLLAGRRFFRPAHDQRWHERMVEYRAVAELLRHERFIYALGAADRPGRTADRTWGEPDAWVGWYVRATLRELGFPRTALSAQSRRDVLATFLKDEIEGDNGQISYNRSSSERFQTIDRRLELIVRRAFWTTVTVASIGIVGLTILGIFVWYDLPGHGAAKHFIHWIKPWFTVIAAFIPALIAAIHGIRFQIEFKGTAVRTAATKRELEEIRKEVVKALEPKPHSPGRKQSVRLVRNANEAMSADLAGWSNFYRGKGPELG